MVPSNNVNIPMVGDILIYTDYTNKPNTFVGIVVDISVLDDGFVNVTDLKVLISGQETVQLVDEWPLHLTNIKKNFGKITIEEFEENYPEWTI